MKFPVFWIAAKKDDIIEPIDAGFEAVTNAIIRPTPKGNKNSALVVNSTDLVPPPSQGELFHVEKQVEINGIEMGVLENGMSYITESGLARMCGLNRKALNRLDWFTSLKTCAPTEKQRQHLQF